MLLVSSVNKYASILLKIKKDNAHSSVNDGEEIVGVTDKLS